MPDSARLEQRLTIVAAFVGLAAIVINLAVYDRFSPSGVLSAIEAAAGLLVTVLVFLVAVRIVKRMDYGDFKKVFEEDLRAWVTQNRFLIDENQRTEGKEGKRFYFMLTKAHHPNFVTEERPACDFETGAGSVWHKGAFLYCDYRDEQVITFGLNKSFFVAGRGGGFPAGFAGLDDLAALVCERLRSKFSSRFDYETQTGPTVLAVEAARNGTRINVSLANLANTRDNAGALIDMIEYVKTLILTIA